MQFPGGGIGRVFLLPTMRALAGILAHLDGFMNIAMEQTEEYVNGQLRVQSSLTV